ncbi:unnamed protein product [Mycena citricolor]|uniref:Pkinase-domain-containing protein n=1 Tax=Mycena citricolor TaxID=2018698 RepID=A0AAD2HJM0_9AGAR|nr:unnamed protein product [Mycena citricolor]
MSVVAANAMDPPPSPGTPTHFATAPRSFVSALRGQNTAFPSTPTTSMNAYFDPPPNTPYSDFIRTWTDAHVARWLSDIKCASHAATFRANDIRGDIILELDQTTLQELGVNSIGDRLRIINAVKSLRMRAAGRPPATPIIESVRSSPRLDISPEPSVLKQERTETSPTTRLGKNRLESGRPAPLQLGQTTARSDLPRLVREQQPPDSARLASSSTTPVRPLPQPIGPSKSRSNLPPLPPPPNGTPPPPPPVRQPNRPGTLNNTPVSSTGRKTPDPAPAYSASQGALLTPSSATHWTGLHLPANPRPDNAGGGRPAPIGRTASPLSNKPTRGTIPFGSKNGNAGASTSSPKRGPPYSSNLQTPASLLNNGLSPIEETFSQRNPATPSSSSSLSLDDLRRKLVRFLYPDDGRQLTVDVGSCVNGIEVLERVLKKFSKSRPAGEPVDVRQTPGGGLSVDGWGIFLDKKTGVPLSEAEVLSVCHAPPNHPVREHGLTLQRTGLYPESTSDGKSLGLTSKATKRASSISVLSGLGVHDPERALDPPSPTSGRESPQLAPPQTPPGKKRPGKLHNFFGQRPPSELITDHLTQYFPMTDKKVLARTARQSMIFRASSRPKRESGASWNPPPVPNRMSFSSQSRPSTEYAAEDIPRVSLSTDDGQSIDLADVPKLTAHPQLLPPIPFPSETPADSIEAFAEDDNKRPKRTLSVASSASGSRRLSFMTEMRSKRDRSDTASLLTVDEITADLATEERADDEWTKVDPETAEGTLIDAAPETLVAEELVKDEGEAPEVDVDEDEVETCEMDDEEVDDDEEDDDEEMDEDDDKPQANKWIKGALIGAGSFGKVYLGMDASTGLLMAVKQVELPTGTAPNQERKKSMLSALEREIELLKDLQHENIVQYLYSSLDDDFLNIFLEYVPGGSVAALLRNYGAFEEPLVKNFVRQILQGLNYLHERDIIHRDIKGANILVDNKGGIKISDFGSPRRSKTVRVVVVALVDSSVDGMADLLTGNRMHRPSLQGSVFWMAPEVVKQSAHTQKADIWSVGCLLVEMLTGEHPWATLTQMQAIFKIGSSAKPTVPSDISSDAQDFLMRTFELNHEARPSAMELLQHPWIGKKPSGKKGAQTLAMVEAAA